MLEYENEMLLDLIQANALVISAKGVCIQKVLQSLIKVYCDPGNLVLVLGFQNPEEMHIIETLKEQNVSPLPRILSAQDTSAERERIYLQGGVLFVSARILVVDLLKERVPTAAITGLLIGRAHTILESCQEAFAVRLYRQNNKMGFIKAFSCTAQAFTSGFAQVLRVMKTLFVSKLMLWPRFHAIVQSTLSQHKPHVVELHLQLTPAMKQIQDSLLELLGYCVREIRRYNPTLEIEDLSVESAAAKPLHKQLQHQLEPLWHQLSAKTRQLIADLKTLRTLLTQFTQYDCVTFYSLLVPLRSSDYAMRSAGWVLLPAAETLFIEAKSRLTGRSDKNSEPEISPKWISLIDILTDINKHLNKHGDKDHVDEKVLILTEERRTCHQLKRFLTLGAPLVLERLTRAILNTKNVPCQPKEVNDGVIAVQEDQLEEDETKEDETDLMLGHCLSMSQRPDDVTEDNPHTDIKLQEPQEDGEQSLPQVLIEPMHRPGDTTALGRLLETVRPMYVIMYDANVTVIRQLEIYQARHPEIKLQIFFVIYGDSVEEQAYLTVLRREKEAFEFLVKEKSTMVIPEDIEGLGDDNALLSRDPRKASETALAAAKPSNRRQGGADAKPPVTPLVLVDMREFRSELPSLLHRRGIDIEPITLQVGDYILTPQLCVERKSIGDLIGSLQSGRLYQQVTAMTRHYAKPVLLIEFDQNKPFALQGKFYVSTDIACRDAMDRLQLLLIHFPKLRLIWSPSPYSTAELFEELKQGQEQPSSEHAAAIGMDPDVQLLQEAFDPVMREFVSRLPGITTKNIYPVLHKVRDLQHLVFLSEEELQDIVGTTQGKALYSGLHHSHTPMVTNKAANKKRQPGTRFQYKHSKRSAASNK